MEPRKENPPRLESRSRVNPDCLPSPFRSGKRLDVYVNVGMMAGNILRVEE